jgi:hypothetical protein
VRQFTAQCDTTYRQGKMWPSWGNQRSNPHSLAVPSAGDIALKAKGHAGPKTRVAQEDIKLHLRRTRKQVKPLGLQSPLMSHP